MKNQAQDGRVISHHGAEYRLRGKAWWLNRAIETQDGRIAVARIEAESITLRMPSAEQLADDGNLNPYYMSADNLGAPVPYLLQLSDQDLCVLDITPGILVWPQVDEGPRPHTNVTENPISRRRYQQEMEWLQNDCIGSPADY